MVPHLLNALADDRQLSPDGMGPDPEAPLCVMPWTTPPIIGHYLVTGGDWPGGSLGSGVHWVGHGRHYPFARAAERSACRAEAAVTADAGKSAVEKGKEEERRRALPLMALATRMENGNRLKCSETLAKAILADGEQRNH